MKEFLIQRYRPDPTGPVIHPTFLQVDDEGRIVRTDRHTEPMFGYDANELLGQPVQRILASREDDPFAPANRYQLDNGQTVLVTFRHKGGFFFTAGLGLRTEVRDADQAANASIIAKDSADMDCRLLKPAEQAAGFGLWELDIASNEISWSDGVYRILELRPGTELTPEQALFYCQAGQNRVRALFRRGIRTGKPFSLELSVLTGCQRLQKITLTGQTLSQDNRTHKLGGVIVNRSESMRHTSEKLQLQNLLMAAATTTPDLVVAVNTELDLLYFNDAWARQVRTAFSVEPTTGANLHRLLDDFPNERQLIERLWQRAFERDHFAAEMPLNRQGESLPVYEFNFHSLRGPGNEVIGAVHVARDISDRIKYSANHDHRMRLDPVTGLMNRRAFLEHLERTVVHRHNRQFCDSLLVLDLDNFEPFRDTAGSGTCDRYLRALAGTLGLKVRQRDILARLAGDTFALYIENCPEPRARKIAEELRDQISQFQFEWQGHQLQTTASGGLLILSNDSPEQPEPLLIQAANLCHTAKTSGRNRIHTAQALAAEQAAIGTDKLLEQLRRALDTGTLLLEFQAIKPVASVTWGDHIEILCRIPGATPEDAPIKPEQFLPIAERFDLAKRLDRQVIRQTLDWLARQPQLEPRLKYCGFNLSLATVLDDSFPDFIEQLVAPLPYQARCFCLEIREAHATQYPDEVAVLCDALHRADFRVALEGAGASVESYSLAANLPVDIIKLDQRVMKHLEKDPVQQIMVDALHRIADAAGKETVATFIENDETLRKVRTLGIHFGQGFRLAEPKPLEQLKPAVVALSTGLTGG